MSYLIKKQEHVNFAKTRVKRVLLLVSHIRDWRERIYYYDVYWLNYCGWIGVTGLIYGFIDLMIDWLVHWLIGWRHVFGKLCFGQGENCEYEAGEISGRKALDHFPLDNWAHHALAHNFEESGRALQVQGYSSIMFKILSIPYK